ncbi:helix-turn-helix domain-containing protein [Mariprofundus ferrooxydans]|nr:helix-turn-helix domain-containing protein [Mariprofundus ferrooxydans]
MYLTTGEAAKRCGVKLNTIKNWIRSGDISAIQTPGGHWRIPHTSFLLFMKKFDAHITPSNADAAMVNKRILVIDDDVSAHELVRGALEMHCPDYEVYSAYDGYSGLIEIGHLQPDLILLDIMMPDSIIPFIGIKPAVSLTY